MSVSRNTTSCINHLFLIEKVVRHSTAGNTDISPEKDKSIEENKEEGVYEYNHPSVKRE